MITRQVSSNESPPSSQVLQNKLLVNADVTEVATDDGVLFQYTQIVADVDADPTDILACYNADVAQAHLDATDFYFTVDKYSQLSEAERTELESSREAARETVRVYKESN